MKYRLIVGKKGGRQIILPTTATTDRGARIALGRVRSRYGSDGWGRIEYQRLGSTTWEPAQVVDEHGNLYNKKDHHRPRVK